MEWKNTSCLYGNDCLPATASMTPPKEPKPIFMNDENAPCGGGIDTNGDGKNDFFYMVGAPQAGADSKTTRSVLVFSISEGSGLPELETQFNLAEGEKIYVGDFLGFGPGETLAVQAPDKSFKMLCDN